MPLAMQGPAAVALKLLTDATCTEEQIDAVALLALSMQKRFDARPDKSSILLPVATPTNNHRAVWLGGGGVGKTRTLNMVVQPLAETFFGPGGYCATAQSNQAAQNLGSKGRTLYSANGLLQNDSLQTARLRLNPQTQKKDGSPRQQPGRRRHRRARSRTRRPPPRGRPAQDLRSMSAPQS